MVQYTTEERRLIIKEYIRTRRYFETEIVFNIHSPARCVPSKFTIHYHYFLFRGHV